MKKITGFACAVVPEGQAINYTYSVTEGGKIIERNVRGSIIVEPDDAELMTAIGTINDRLNALIQ